MRAPLTKAAEGLHKRIGDIAQDTRIMAEKTVYISGSLPGGGGCPGITGARTIPGLGMWESRSAGTRDSQGVGVDPPGTLCWESRGGFRALSNFPWS